MDKVDAITNAPTPTNVSELKSYLGLLNYYGKFLPNISTVLSPLHQLLRKDSKWKWAKNEQEAFDKSKSLLNSSQVLVHYDSEKELILATDTSQYGLGAVLSHIYEDGTERPIAFASRTLNDAERNYSRIEKEGLSVIFGVKKFHAYLYGRRFYINNDHKPLETLFSEKKGVPVTASSRIQRWALTLSAYDYTFKYKPGKNLCHADTMSRLPLSTTLKSVPTPSEVKGVVQFLDSTTITSIDIEKTTHKDPVLSRVRRFITNGWTDEPDPETQPFKCRQSELSFHGGIILRGARVVVPPQCQPRVLEMLHILRMKMLARSYVWWPKIDSDIESSIRECSQCQINAKATPAIQMHPWEYPQNPWTRVHIDYAGPFENKMFLIVVDAHSKWIDVHITNSTSPQVTIEKLERTFATCGLPVTIVSDNGTSFTSTEFQQFLKNNGIEQMFSPPYHPSSNGLAGRAVQTFKDYMKKTVGQPLHSRISRFLFHYRSTPNTTTGKSLTELLFKRKMRTHLDFCPPDEISKVQRAQSRQKAVHDSTTRSKSLEKGDAVYVSNFGKGTPWIPGHVVNKKQSLCIVELLDGRKVHRHLGHIKIRQAEELLQPWNHGTIHTNLCEPGDRHVTSTLLNARDLVNPTPSTGPSETTTTTTVTKPHVTVTQQLRRSTRASRPPQRLDL